MTDRRTGKTREALRENLVAKCADLLFEEDRARLRRRVVSKKLTDAEWREAQILAGERTSKGIRDGSIYEGTQ